MVSAFKFGSNPRFFGVDACRIDCVVLGLLYAPRPAKIHRLFQTPWDLFAFLKTVRHAPPTAMQCGDLRDRGEGEAPLGRMVLRGICRTGMGGWGNL